MSTAASEKEELKEKLEQQIEVLYETWEDLLEQPTEELEKAMSKDEIMKMGTHQLDRA